MHLSDRSQESPCPRHGLCLTCLLPILERRGTQSMAPSPLGPYAHLLQSNVLILSPQVRAPNIVLKGQHLRIANQGRSRLLVPPTPVSS